MLRKYRWPIGLLALALLSLGYLGAKAFYLGWQFRQEASVGGYEVKSFQTISSVDPRALMARDGTCGYHRIFDERGRKVFEVFSDSLNFDIVLSKEDGVEFQLGSETIFWPLPEK